MKILKGLLIIILVLIAIPLIIGLFIPTAFTAESEIIINQPTSQVYTYLKHLKNQDEYAMWNQMDPDMKKEYVGEDGTVGFISKWESENSMVGKGEQEITELIKNQEVKSEIRIEGWDTPMIARLQTEATRKENQTRVKWTVTGENPYPFNVMGLLMDMENDLQTGLKDLKQVLENQETKSDSDGKAFLLNYFEKTKAQLQQAVADLSAAQLQYKPADSIWSVSQCMEHIMLTEQMLFDMTKESLEKPENPALRDSIQLNDQEVIAMITNREQKAKAPQQIQGSGKYTDAQQALSDFEAQRKTMLQLIEKQPVEALRNHVDESPAGKLDAYQSLLFLAGHTARHTQQIEAVKADEAFPKS